MNAVRLATKIDHNNIDSAIADGAKYKRYKKQKYAVVVLCEKCGFTFAPNA